jgi:phosphorylase kinase alpha/beta subunit
MVRTLEALEYWHDSDSGLWEENEEMHASSIGACVSGLKALKSIGFDIKDELIQKGVETLNKLLPNESPTKEVDLALLTLIYPFGDAINDAMKAKIVKNVEEKILRNNGVIRYIGDWYYNTSNNCFSVGTEAEWTFGLAYLGMYYVLNNNLEKAKFYLNKIMKNVKDGNVPELYFSNTDTPNENTPLGWSVAMTIVLIEEILNKAA